MELHCEGFGRQFSVPAPWLCPARAAVRTRGMRGVAADRDDAVSGHDAAAAYEAPSGTAADRGIRRSPNGAGDLGIAGRPEPDEP